MAGTKKYVCLTGITEYNKKTGEKKVFEVGDEYTGDNAKWHLEIGDPNTGPSIGEKSDLPSSDSAAADNPEENK